jgi:hypothetical protein
MNRIAYIISSYKDAAHLVSLIDALSVDADFYIHVDANVDKKPFTDAVGSRAVFVPSHRISWGGWNQVVYQKELLKAAVDSGKKYSHVVCLSGQDYPLWSNERIHELFRDNPEREFICGYNLTHTDNKWQRGKVTNYHLFRDLPWSNTWLKNKVIVASRHLLSFLQLHKHPYIEIDGAKQEVYFGSDYWALTLPCARYVVQRLTDEPRYAKYFRSAFVPSELCIQTIVFNSPFAANAMLTTGAYPGLDKLTPLHYIDYHGAIKQLTAADLPALLKADKMFCRKVVTGTSDELKELIDGVRNSSKL